MQPLCPIGRVDAKLLGMKLKCQPEDFLVEELPVIEPGRDGRFTFYRLSKTGIGTLEALEAIRHRWNLSTGQIAHGGLKDKHATTIQYLTILGGPERSLHQSNLELEPLGRMDRPYGPQGFRGNRFTIVMRDLTPTAATSAEKEAISLKEGIPNYFDDQRFGSLGKSGDFIAEAWVKGDQERALYLALAEPNDHDRPDARAEKDILRATWGQWVEAKAQLQRSHARSLVTYLVDHPTDFKGAFARLNKPLRSLYFSAYQSHLWNLLLARWIHTIARPEQIVEIDFAAARLPLFRHLEPEQIKRLTAEPIPLPSARDPLPTGPLGEIVVALLAERGLTWEAIRVRGLKDLFFSKGSRAGVMQPGRLEVTRGDDELYKGKICLTLAFELPRGAYATLLVKRLTLLQGEPAA